MTVLACKNARLTRPATVWTMPCIPCDAGATRHPTVYEVARRVPLINRVFGNSRAAQFARYPRLPDPRLRRRIRPLFACIDEQYDDAVTLLKDPEHAVTNPVGIAGFKQAEQNQVIGPMFLDAGTILLILLGIVGAMIAIRLHT